MRKTSEQKRKEALRLASFKPGDLFIPTQRNVEHKNRCHILLSKGRGKLSWCVLQSDDGIIRLHDEDSSWEFDPNWWQHIPCIDL